MRILVVTPWFPTAESAASGVFVQREVEALTTRHEVTVLHLDWQRGTALDPSSRGGYRYRHVPLSRANPLAYRAARRIVTEIAQSHDVTHTHALTGLVPWLAGRPSGGRPWVHSEHWSGITAPETLRAPDRLALRVLGRRLRSADAVIAESSRLANGIRRFRASPIDVVPCVVDAVTPVERPRGPGLRLVAVGSLIARKGPMLAVDALAELVSRGVPAELTWVGAGPLATAVSERAREMDVGDRLRLAGALDAAGVTQELQAASLFILPTQGDNFCVVVAEALVNGRPVVSGAATGAVDYAAPAVSRFVEPQTGAAYADAVEDLARATASLGADEIAATVAGRFDRVRVADELSRIYMRVAG
ncbi:glycosyltransferase [Microbacterium sp. NPDC058345]|uniref:glycosyltransferase n=1 Tax=Microbacterium sp. NPDC058345 TaxID=3346455 RepID=UPI0036633639